MLAIVPIEFKYQCYSFSTDCDWVPLLSRSEKIILQMEGTSSSSAVKASRVVIMAHRLACHHLEWTLHSKRAIGVKLKEKQTRMKHPSLNNQYTTSSKKMRKIKVTTHAGRETYTST